MSSVDYPLCSYKASGARETDKSQSEFMSCIVQTADGKTKEVKAVPFEDEAELETVIVKHPNLLQAPRDFPLRTVDRRVRLPDAGIIDVLQIDQEGLPVVVEVKLARNGETRRTIVAQIFDYVSDLTLMSADEIDDLVDGKLGTALEDADKAVSDERWKNFGRQLRDGRTRFILAVDETPESLARIMEFLHRHFAIAVATPPMPFGHWRNMVKSRDSAL